MKDTSMKEKTEKLDDVRDAAVAQPWYATGIHVQSSAVNEDNYVCKAEGDSGKQAVVTARLIVHAVNNIGDARDSLKEAHAVVYALALDSGRLAEFGPYLDRLYKHIRRIDSVGL